MQRLIRRALVEAKKPIPGRAKAADDHQVDLEEAASATARGLKPIDAPRGQAANARLLQQPRTRARVQVPRFAGSSQYRLA